MGQAKLRGSFEQRKAVAEFHIGENERLQCWLRANRPKETREQRNARTTLNVLRAMAFGSGLLFLTTGY